MSASLKERLARGVYVFALRLLLPAYLWRVWSRGREEPGYRVRWWERLGVYGAAHRAQARGDSGAPLLWVHAVSLGETRAASALVAELRRQHPDLRLLLTHSTATGRDAGRALLDPARGDVQAWLPFDLPGAVRRFLRCHRPVAGVLMETEVWPVLQHQAACAGVPMVLANARLSDKSLRQGLRLRVLMQPAVRTMDAVLAQTQADADRVRALLQAGVPSSAAAGSVRPPQEAAAAGGPVVEVCGNVKFDMSPAAELLARGQAWARGAASGRAPRRIVLAASTREGEEAGLLQAWVAAVGRPAADAPPRLLIVPRHPQRFDEVHALVTGLGLRCSRRITWPAEGPDEQALQADVWLGDSVGEMAAYYASAAVALLGGSFAPLGGQNLIEAAACGCPIVAGPSTFNFAEAAELSEQAGAARRAVDWVDGVRLALAWMDEPDETGRRERCLAFAQAHRGAAARMAARILQTAGLG